MNKPAKKLNAVTAASLTIALLSGGLATAGQHEGPPPGHHGKMMTKIDTDGDGRISKDEFATFHNEKFDRMDSNGDGYIDANERKEHHQKRHPKPE